MMATPIGFRVSGAFGTKAPIEILKGLAAASAAAVTNSYLQVAVAQGLRGLAR